MSYSYSSASAHENGLLPPGVEPDDFGGDFFGDLAFKQWLFKDQPKDTTKKDVDDSVESATLKFTKEK